MHYHNRYQTLDRERAFSFSFISHSQLFYWFSLAILLITLSYPFLITKMPPLLDYPIHLARSHIFDRYQEDSILKSMFVIDWRPIPNLGSDIFLSLLTKILPIELAGRLFITLIAVLTVLGVVMLHRAMFHSFRWWPFIVVIPAHHGALSAGFLNYSLGLALVPIALALHIFQRKRASVFSIIVNSLSAIVIYFCHIIPVGLFVTMLLSFEFCRSNISLKFRRNLSELANIVSKTTLPMILPGLLYVKYSFFEVISKPDPMVLGEWDISQKIRGMMMPFISGNYVYDFFSMSVTLSILIFVIVFQKKEFSKGIFLGCLVIFIAFFFLPSHLLEAAFIPERLTVAIVIFLIAGSNPTIQRRSSRVIITCSVFTLLLIRSGLLTMSWGESDYYYQRLSSIIKTIDPGSSVMIVSPFSGVRDKSFRFWHDIRMSAPSWYFTLLNIPTLHAMPIMPLTNQSAFSQLHFVWPDKQVLSLSEKFSRLDYGDGGASTWHPSEVFLDPDGPYSRFETVGEPFGAEANWKDCTWNGEQRLGVTSYARQFDYILILYAEYLPCEFRKRIAAQHADNGVILAKISPYRNH